jgi:hypothetical protein
LTPQTKASNVHTNKTLKRPLVIERLYALIVLSKI